MHRRGPLILAAAALLGACGEGTETARRLDPRCDGREIPPVGPGGIGPAQLGVRVAVLSGMCDVADTSLVLAEGLRERAHVVRFGDHRVIAISTGSADTSIVRLIVRDSVFRTPQGLGVGSTIGEMRSFYPVLGYADEGQRVVTIPGLPGLSFAYDGVNLPAHPARVVALEPAAMDSARVTSFWIFRPIPR